MNPKMQKTLENLELAWLLDTVDAEMRRVLMQCELTFDLQRKQVTALCPRKTTAGYIFRFAPHKFFLPAIVHGLPVHQLKIIWPDGRHFTRCRPRLEFL